MAWTVAILVLVGLTIDFVMRLLAVRLILPVFERKPPFGKPPQGIRNSDETVTIPTTNGMNLHGRIFRQSQQPPQGVIVFCPEMEGDSTSASYYCEALLDAGFELLAFDFRNQGESESLENYEPLHWVTEYEVEDAMAAVRFVRDQPDWADLPLGMVGISRGGGAALAAAARCSDIQSVLVEGAFSTERLMEYYTLRWAALYIPQWLLNLFPLWHVRGTLALVRLISQARRRCRYVRLEREMSRLKRKPVLLIQGARDTYVPKQTSKQLTRYLGKTGTSWVVPDANHNKARESAGEEYDHRMVDFFIGQDCLSSEVEETELTRTQTV
ncbi:MAG: alpha/beta hydrolase [Planctomycetaceae bacterium]|nr:alpha/beta hydrolase [Planctomycetaceae bacterium]